MAPGWGFGNLAPATTSASQLVVICLTSPANQKTFRCSPVEISEFVVVYQEPHFLALPAEIRNHVWYTIFLDIIESLKAKPYQRRPQTEYDSLIRVCRQVWCEVQHLWPQIFVPKNQIERFLAYSPSKSVGKNLKSLTVELPFNSPLQFFQLTAKALDRLAEFLEDLRIFFVGKDKYGVPTNDHGCGMIEPIAASTSTKLAIDGQGCEERYPVFKALVNLWNLRSLLLSNPQFPLLQGMLLSHKSRLENLQIFTDPRQTLHTDFGPTFFQIQGLIKPPTDKFPPVRILHLSANAGLTSLQIASKLALKLEEFTWVVPDGSRQAGRMGGNWLSDTAVLLSNLQRNAKRLRILRICIEGTIYESHHHYGQLIGALKTCLPRMRSLETLEIHLTSKSSYFGGEILHALPQSLLRFYISDKTVSFRDIEELAVERYWTRSMDKTRRSEITIRIEEKIEQEDDERFVGEDLTRRDYIRMDSALAFIGFEYDASKVVKTVMMGVNGRLLDRERNQHLRAYEGRMIPPRGAITEVDTDDNETEVSSEETRLLRIYSVESRKLYKPSFGETQTILSQLRMSGFTEDKSYFGNENEAEKVFNAEAVAKMQDLPALRYPEEVEVGGHWMSE